MNEEQLSASSTALIDALNNVVLSVDGVTELYPPQSVLHSAADQLLAFVKGNSPLPIRTVAVAQHGDGLKVIARVGVDSGYRTPEVISQIAIAIRRYIAAEINAEIRCVTSVQAVSIK